MDDKIAKIINSDRDLRMVQVHPEIMDGLPVVRNTRVPVSFILELLESGYDEPRIREQFPTLPAGCARVALRFAARMAALA